MVRYMEKFEQAAGWKNFRDKVFEVSGRTLLIRLKEDLDHHNAVYIREMADRLMEEQLLQNVVFDFGGVDFMDSSGIGVVMGRYKRVSYVGGTVRVTGIGQNVDRIFKMSGLYKLVQKFDTIEEAMQ